MADPQEVYDALDALGIRYEKYEHPPVFTGEEAAEHWDADSRRRASRTCSCGTRRGIATTW